MPRSQDRAAAPKVTKADRDRKVAAASLLWTKRGAVIGLGGVVVAIGLASIPFISDAIETREDSADITATTMPHDPIGGAPVFPVAGARRPSGYLGAGVSLQIDCLQEVEPSYLIAHISDGRYVGKWIDAFDLKTPRGEDIRMVQPRLPRCGPPVTLAPEPTIT
jgi:hypothetical protein